MFQTTKQIGMWIVSKLSQIVITNKNQLLYNFPDRANMGISATKLVAHSTKFDS